MNTRKLPIREFFYSNSFYTGLNCQKETDRIEGYDTSGGFL